jgi:8-oxo-dGTP pyrophosphatase MutT (NUDIX family)
MTQKPDWMVPQGPPWTVVRERAVYDNPWLAVAEYDAVAPTGQTVLYGVVRFKNLALTILPLHADGTITLVGQHRFAIPGYSWELPEGGGPVGDDPLDNARRELREEAGLEAAEWRQVLKFQLSNSVTDEVGYGFLATDLTPAPALPDETEALALARAPFRKVLDQALSGNILDMPTVALLLRAYHMAREGALPDALAKSMLS